MVQTLREKWSLCAALLGCLPKRRAGTAVRPLAPLENQPADPGMADGSSGVAANPETDAEMQREAEEETASKALSSPPQPTPQMIEDHRASGHLPFRSWCPACVRGRGKSVAHKQVDRSEEAVPTISIDYSVWILRE